MLFRDRTGRAYVFIPETKYYIHQLSILRGQTLVTPRYMGNTTDLLLNQATKSSLEDQTTAPHTKLKTLPGHSEEQIRGGRQTDR